MKVIERDRYSIGYEHVPIYASSNPITGTKYLTKIYLLSKDKPYTLNTLKGRLSEDEIIEKFELEMAIEEDKKYGQQRSIFRRELRPVRQRTLRPFEKRLS